jgi:protocatechuate 3,4-dioxygenase beta subunit
LASPAPSSRRRAESRVTRGARRFSLLRPGRHRRALAALILSAAALLLVHEAQRRESAPLGFGARVTRDAPGSARSLLDPATGKGAPRPAPGSAPVRPVFAPAAGGPPVEVILGRVTGPDGAAVAGATVEVEGVTVFTGADGRFRLPRASGRVRITHRDHFPREVDAAMFPPRLARPGDDALLDAAPDGSGTLDIVLAPGARVHGAVLGPDGEPLAGARVHFGAADAPAEAVTDARGAYESPLLAAGSIPVFVSHPGHQPHGGTAVLSPGSFRARFDVRLRGGERISVRVKGPGGEPVSDAEVWIRLERREPPRSPGLPAGEREARALEEWMFLGRTGDLGGLETRREAGKDARMRILAAGFREAVRRVDGTEVSFRLEPAPALRGHAVHAGTGLPLALTGVRLEVLTPAGFEEAPDRGRLFRSLTPGKFIVGLPPYAGVYRVAATAERGFRGTSGGLAFDGKDAPAPAIVRLEERHEIRGVVRGPDGPAEGAAIELVHEEASGRRLERLLGAIVPAPHRIAREVSSGAGGRFALEDVAPGTYRIRARKAGLAEHLSPPFTLPWEGDYFVVLPRAASIGGTLLDSDGAPEAGAPLVLTRKDDPARVAWTDRDGRFSFEGLPPGKDYRLRIGDPAGYSHDPAGYSHDPARARAEPVDLEEVPLEGASAAGEQAPAARAWDLVIEEGARVTFDPSREPSPTGSVRGRIAAGGEAAPGERVVIRRKDGPGEGAEETALADARGEFRFSGLEPGTYELRAEDLSAQGEVTVAAGRRASADLEGSTHRARFELVDALTSEPFPGTCEVELVRRDGGAATRTARSGTTPIEIDGLPAGKYLARARAGGLLHWEDEIEVPSTQAEIVPIERGDDLTFQLLVADGIRFRGRAEVVLWKGGREVYRVVEEIGGSVTVPSAGPGDYELLVHSEDRRAHVTFAVAREEVEKESGAGDN